MDALVERLEEILDELANDAYEVDYSVSRLFPLFILFNLVNSLVFLLSNWVNMARMSSISNLQTSKYGCLRPSGRETPTVPSG